ncbi:histidine phosphatase family protein [Falsihalocynthiibacter sp. SS001]|uniref:histidine phosphatase family protein n=1 Tax=Falsihalocynthiibacter sp. SS001 TaxID=3349698 RepID=UPI0036D23DCD
MTRLWWVRHAPTHAKSMVGWSDISADVSDDAAFDRLNDALPRDAAIISSPLKRAQETAAKLTRNRVQYPLDADLREIHFGRWEGLTFDQANAQDPDLLKQFWDKPGASTAPDGESWDELCARVGGAADRIAKLPPDDIIVVAHFGAILCQVQRALNISTTDAFAQKIDNLSISCLSFDGRWSADCINQIP